MSFHSTIPFDGTLTKNVNNELWIAVAFDIPAGAFLQATGWHHIPHTAAGLNTHPSHDFICLTNWGVGLRGDFTIEYSWIEDGTITQQMIDTHASVMQASNAGTEVVFEYTEVDFVTRTAKCRLSVPANADLDWRGSPFPWGLAADDAKYIFDEGQYYLCATILSENWQDWTSEARDIAPNSSLVIDRVEGASSVYLVFSEEVTTSTGVTLDRGVAYSQTSTSMEVTAGSTGAFVIRVSG